MNLISIFFYVRAMVFFLCVCLVCLLDLVAGNGNWAACAYYLHTNICYVLMYSSIENATRRTENRPGLFGPEFIAPR